MNRFSLSELCNQLICQPPLILTIQKALGLHIPTKAQGYSPAYANFLKKVISLHVFDIPLADIKEVFDTEKKILQLLHLDSLTESPTWYLDNCSIPEPLPDRLLLTGHKVESSGDGQAVQHTLDFSRKDRELFRSADMGEDVKLILAKYHALTDALRKKIAMKKNAMEAAIEWSKRFIKHES